MMICKDDLSTIKAKANPTIMSGHCDEKILTNKPAIITATLPKASFREQIQADFTFSEFPRYFRSRTTQIIFAINASKPSVEIVSAAGKTG